MRRLLLIAPLFAALLAVGCNDSQIARGARDAVERSSNDCGEYSCAEMHEYRLRLLREREEQEMRDAWNRWKRENPGRGRDDYPWRNQPGYPPKTEPGYHPPRYPHLQFALGSEPAISRGYVEMCRKVGKKFGISTSAAVTLMDALNRATIKDFRGLASLGITRAGIKAAHKNNGRLSSAELSVVSRKLGTSEQRVDRMIQALLK